MTDIPIIFSTNAAVVAPQVEAAAKATEHADAAGKKIHSTWERVTHAITHLTMGYGRHVTMAQKMGGVVGAVAIGYIAFERVLHSINVVLERHHKWLEKSIESEVNLEKAVRKTNMTQSQRGVDFGKKEGANIRKLTATGGLDMANKFASTTGDFGESAKAVLAAKHKFGDQAENGLKIAARISNVTGESLNKTIEAMHKGDLSNPDAAAQRISRKQTGDKGLDFKAAEQKISASATVSALNNINKNSGAIANSDLGLVSQSALASGNNRAEALNPLSGMQVEKFAESMDKLRVLNEINTHTGIMAQAIAVILSPGKESDAANARNALMNIGAEQ